MAVRGSPDPARIVTDRSQQSCGRPAVGGSGEVGRPRRALAARAQRRNRYLTLGATAAVVLIGVAIWKFFGAETTASAQAVAVQVLEAQQVVPGDWQAGQTVSLNQLNITSGMLQVRIADSGVRLRVSGPAELRLVDPMLARVVRGQVTADVDEQGKGFSMETAQAKLVDLGTKFGVDVSDRDTTDVVVFRGTVQVFKDHRDQRRDLPLSTLTEGEAVRVGAGRTMARIPNIVTRPMPSRWTTAAPTPEECVIASVRDNLRSPDTKIFYEIVPGGLAEGVQAYVGPRHLWKGRTPTGLPPYLIGADFVRTFMSDHRKQKLGHYRDLLPPGRAVCPVRMPPAAAAVARGGQCGVGTEVAAREFPEDGRCRRAGRCRPAPVRRSDDRRTRPGPPRDVRRLEAGNP